MHGMVLSTPSITPILGLAKSGGIPKTAVLGFIYNIKNTHLGLENEQAVLGGRRYWEGGIEGDDCTTSHVTDTMDLRF